MANKDRVAELRKSGKTLREIGKEIGLSCERVRQLCKELGLPQKACECGSPVRAPRSKYCEACFKSRRKRRPRRLTCPVCSQEFFPTGAASKYCSVICQKEAARHGRTTICLWGTPAKWVREQAKEHGVGPSTFMMQFVGNIIRQESKLD